MIHNTISSKGSRMKKLKLFLVFLICTSLYAQEHILKQANNNLSSKIIKNNKTYVRKGLSGFWLRVEPIEVWEDSLRRREYSLNYIANVTASIDNEIILDADLNHYLNVWRQPAIWFESKSVGTNQKNITYRVTDNHGNSAQESFKIEISGNQDLIQEKQIATVVPKIKIDQQAWQSTTVEEAVQSLYGSDAIKNINQTDFISFCKNEMCYHDRWSPVVIKMDSIENVESISLFSTATEKSLLAVLVFPRGNVNLVKIPMRFEKDGELFAIARMTDGSLYKSTSGKIREAINIESDTDYIETMTLLFKK